MKTLIYGAGILGSLYAALLKKSGKNISILARGKRLQEIKEQGINIENLLLKTKIETQIDLVEERLSEKDEFDLIFVIMQKNQIQSILPDLAKYSKKSTIIFLGNNGTGIEEYQEFIEPERIILGFPSAAGKRDRDIMRVVFDNKKSKIILGDPTGKLTKKLKDIKNYLIDSGIPAKINKNIDAWLKAHIALVSPLANVHFMLKSENKTIIESPDALNLTVEAIIEGINVLKKLGYPIYPRLFLLIPFAPNLLKKRLINVFTGEWFDIALAGHADYAVNEMRRIAEEFQVLINKAKIPTPSIDKLYNFIPN